MIAPDPDHPNIVYGDRVDKFDTRTGQTRDVDPTLAYPEIHHRGAWTLPLAFSRRGKRALYFDDQHLLQDLRRRRSLDSDQPGSDASGCGNTLEPRRTYHGRR